MNKLDIKQIDPIITLLSGQTFLWKKTEKKIIGSFIDKIVILEQVNSDWYWQTYPEKDNYEFIKKYFGVEVNEGAFVNKFNTDNHVVNAYKKYNGIRVLNQPFEETIISFILASNKNIKAIRKSLDILKFQQNRRIKIDGKNYYLFPNIEYFNKASINEISKSGTGYRTKYLKDLAKKFESLIITDDYPRTLDSLKSVHGIGNKIADCVMTFSLGFKNLTPIDRWSERIIEDLYDIKNLKKYEEKRDWFSSRFGEHTSYAGQLLFEYIRGYNPYV